MVVGLRPHGNVPIPHNCSGTILFINHPRLLCQAHFVFHILLLLLWRKRWWLKVSRIIKCSSGYMPLYQISLFNRIWSSKRRPSQGRGELLRACVDFQGGGTKFWSSIIPDWYLLDSEVYTAATPAHASDSWDRRIGEVCSLGHQVSCQFLVERNLFCSFSLHCLSCCALNSLRCLKKENRLKCLEATSMYFSTLHNHTAQWLTFFFFFFWVLRLAELWSKFLYERGKKKT